MRREGNERIITVIERRQIPLDGLLLGFGAMLPFPIALAALWLGDAATGALAVAATKTWGAAILIFLAGVRRGLSFRTPGGPRPTQVGMALWLFVSGLAPTVLPAFPALSLILAGYASLLVLDPIAARHDETPLYFARLRPWQMAIPVTAITLMLVTVF